MAFGVPASLGVGPIATHYLLFGEAFLVDEKYRNM